MDFIWQCITLTHDFQNASRRWPRRSFTLYNKCYQHFTGQRHHAPAWPDSLLHAVSTHLGGSASGEHEKLFSFIDLLLFYKMGWRMKIWRWRGKRPAHCSKSYEDGRVRWCLIKLADNIRHFHLPAVLFFFLPSKRHNFQGTKATNQLSASFLPYLPEIILYCLRDFIRLCIQLHQICGLIQIIMTALSQFCWRSWIRTMRLSWNCATASACSMKSLKMTWVNKNPCSYCAGHI